MQSIAPSVTTGTGISRNNHGELVGWPADISSTLNASFGTKLGLENQHINADCPMFVPTKAFYESSLAQYKESDVGGTAKASGGVAGGGSETFIAQPIALAENTIGRQPHNGGNGDGFTAGGPMYTLNATGVHGVAQPIAFSGCDDGVDLQINVTPTMRVAGNSQGNLAVAVGTDLYNGNITGDVAATMGTPGSSINASGPTVMQSMAVRRLTPVECERLQGFSDNYTDIKSKNKPTPDGPRYKALGNSMAVPVMAWIGARIQQYENMQ
jgi:DNA (cytosine-5)-methyltransferase 1